MGDLLRSSISFVFSPDGGGFGYPYHQKLTAATIAIAIAMTIVVLAFVHISRRSIVRREALVVTAWLAIGLACQLAFLSLGRYSLSSIIESDAANGFYSVALRYPAGEFLREAERLAPTLPSHVWGNMPGKVLLFDALQLVTASPLIMALGIIVLSNLGGVLLYLIAKDLFHDSDVALYSLVLYLLQPAKVFFFPLLNVVVPLVALAPIYLLLRHLETNRRRHLIGFGVSLFALIVFEPTPLVLGLVMAALVARYQLDGRLGLPRFVAILGWSLAAFSLVTGLAWLAGFDLFRWLRFVFDDARSFNEAGRPYGFWLVHNLKDFTLHNGVAQSALWLIATGGVILSSWRLSQRPGALRPYLQRTDTLLLLSFTLTLVALNALGLNRGETTRLWIFLGSVLQLVAAQQCAARGGFLPFAAVCALTITQTAICARAIGWVIP